MNYSSIKLKKKKNKIKAKPFSDKREVGEFVASKPNTIKKC